MPAGFCSRYGATKPKLPYTNGDKLVLRPHRPTMPAETDCCSYNPETDWVRQTQHPVEVCRKRPPLRNQDIQKTCKIHVVVVDDAIRSGDNKAAQIVLVRVELVEPSSPSLVTQGKHYVVKFYDPLYSNNDEQFTDPFLRADRNYACEAAAYNHPSLKDLQGDLIPRFYGTYSAEIITPLTTKMMGRAPRKTQITQPHVTREVRCIMIEHIPGTVMAAWTKNLHPDTSRALLKAVFDAEARIYERKVDPLDFAPRNIILSWNGNNFSVKIVDLADAGIHYDPGEEVCRLWAALKLMNSHGGCYISPKWRWNTANLEDQKTVFHPWVTWKESWQTWLDTEYKKDHQGLSPQAREQLRSHFVC